jgi:hypothetical protein
MLHRVGTGILYLKSVKKKRNIHLRIYNISSVNGQVLPYQILDFILECRELTSTYCGTTGVFTFFTL